MLTLEKFEEASEIVKRVTRPTKLIYSEYLSSQTGGKVYLKPENMQYTGAYKLRGAYYKISTLTEEERQTVEAFAKQIDLTNSSLILQYGAGTQKKMADFSESALDNVKSQDLGEVGDLLTGVVTQLKSFDEDEEENEGGLESNTEKTEEVSNEIDENDESKDEILDEENVNLNKENEKAVRNGCFLFCKKRVE